MDAIFRPTSIVSFTNTTDTTFTHTIGGSEMTFEPNVTYKLQENIAQHFALHLAQRELLKKGATDSLSIEQEAKKFIGVGFEVKSEFDLAKKVQDMNMSLEKKKAGRPAKEEEKEVVKEEVVEEVKK